jgi:hypothetical protein
MAFNFSTVYDPNVGRGPGVPPGSTTSGLTAVSQYAEQLMQQQYAWGQAQFQQNSQLTDQVVGNLMSLYGQLTGAGNQLMSQYQSLFAPEYQQLVTDANNYSSQARIQQAMGAAESGVAQQFNGARNAALADLQSFGIDPSSGRYAALDAAERTQAAAAQAGAGFQAEQATEATGRGLRSEALQLGSVMPSQATAAYNAAEGAATAGENAKLANAQEGVNMLGSPTQHGAVAQQLHQAQSYPPFPNPGGGGSNSGSGGGSRTYSADNTWRPAFGGSQGLSSPDQQDTQGPNAMDVELQREGFAQQQQNAKMSGSNGGIMQLGDQPSADQSGVYDASQYGGSPVDPNAGETYQPTPGFDQGALPQDQYSQDMGNFANDSSGSTLPMDTSSSDTSSQPSFDTSGDQPFVDTSGDSGYAEGGAIPVSKSPSRGRKVDDIRARVNQTNEPVRLNAGEHVMTRAAVAKHGRKFFDDINRKARGGAIPMSR